jgi:hypothetical protein
VDDPRGLQAAFNAASREHWDAFAPHRRRVSALLGADAAHDWPHTRLCVLGAGNGNDLDLPALLAAHREVHLVDLDPVALAGGAARQAVAGYQALRLHGGVDLTGMLDAIAAWTPHTSIGPADLAALGEWPAGRVGPTLPGPFDVVASTCLLSQLIGTAFKALGPGHPSFGAVLRAVRAGHLRLLARLAGPGGVAVLITDVVSTDTFPALASVPESALPGLLPKLRLEGNYIHGVHPADLLSALRTDPVLSAEVRALEPAEPWRWRLHERGYLVWALRYRVGESRPR